MTNEEKIHGIVTRYTDYKEYHRMLTVFTPNYGFISMLSAGCKSPKSKLRAGSELFVFGKYLIKNKGERKSLKEVEILDPFYDLRTEITALSCAVYLRDFCEFTTIDLDDAPEMFSLFVSSISLLCHNKIGCKLVQFAFEIRAMRILGFDVNFDECFYCGSKEYLKGFSVENGGVVCSECMAEGILKASPRAIKTMSQIATMPMDKLGVIRLNEETIKEIDAFWHDYIRWHVERRFKSADFLNKSYSF